MSIKKCRIGQMRNGSEVLPKEKRKLILFAGDLLLRPSGIGSQTKQIIYGTCHRYNFINFGYIQGLQPENVNYQIQDLSQRLQEQTGVPDATLFIKPFDIYSGRDEIKQRVLLNLIKQLKPDALFHFTDPHSWYWMYEIQNLIRCKIPIIYYNIWDNLPYPKYNEKYYSCSDLIMNISKQTQNIVNNVCINYPREVWQTKYVPHGINMETFRPMGKNNPIYKTIYQQLHRSDYDFVFLFVNKNIIRKQASLIMEAFRYFVNNYLTPEQKARTILLMKTEVNIPPGMPLNIYQNEVLHDPTVNIQFISNNLQPEQLCALYNCADCIVSFSSAEGFGLSTAEGLACGKIFIAPVIGGLQDQMGFQDENGKLYFNNPKVPSNCYRTYKKHKPWVIPIWLKGLASTGSMATPYIYEMYYELKDLVLAMKKAYEMPKQERQKYGLEGREWMLSQEVKMSADWMCTQMIQHIDNVFKYWKPKSKYKLFRGQRIKKDTLSGIYDPIKQQWE